MNKIALFVFNGDPMCFIHVLLNGLNMHKNNYEVKIIIEGAAVKIIPELEKMDKPMPDLWEKVKKAGIIEGVCMACANKLGTLENAKSQGLKLLNDMNGHPSMSQYINAGFQIITF